MKLVVEDTVVVPLGGDDDTDTPEFTRMLEEGVGTPVPVSVENFSVLSRSGGYAVVRVTGTVDEDELNEEMS